MSQGGRSLRRGSVHDLVPSPLAGGGCVVPPLATPAVQCGARGRREIDGVRLKGTQAGRWWATPSSCSPCGAKGRGLVAPRGSDHRQGGALYLRLDLPPLKHRCGDEGHRGTPFPRCAGWRAKGAMPPAGGFGHLRPTLADTHLMGGWMAATLRWVVKKVRVRRGVSGRRRRSTYVTRRRVAPFPLATGATVITADPGAYAVGGGSVGLRHNYSLAVESGAYSLSGSQVALAHAHRMAALGASYALEGATASLGAGKRLASGAGSYALTGSAVTMTNHHALTVDLGAYVLTGRDVGLSTGDTAGPGGSVVRCLVYVPGAMHATVFVAGAGGY